MKLTPQMVHRLQLVRDLGPSAWCHGAGRAGGSISRMFDRMKVGGFVTGPPYELTNKALNELADVETNTRIKSHGQDPS